MSGATFAACQDGGSGKWGIGVRNTGGATRFAAASGVRITP